MTLVRRWARLPRQITLVPRRPALALRLAVRGCYARSHARIMSAPVAAATVPVFAAALAFSLRDVPGGEYLAGGMAYLMWRIALKL